jgi:hypothetical protein|tara:strand:+ start:7976 stop:8110 length:135 start_codon:yes stop_codon:yes gene_type:complete
MEKFEKGMSIVQLEERYEMAASGDRSRTTTIVGGPGSVGIQFNL